MTSSSVHVSYVFILLFMLILLPFHLSVVHAKTVLPSLHLKYNTKNSIETFDGKTRKVAYLTLDDGPTRFTPKLIETLNKLQVPATHFVIGRNVKRYPQYVRDYLKRGDYVGMHSMTHQYKKLYVEKELVQEVKEEQQLLSTIANIHPTLLRAPYGSYPGVTEDLQEALIENNIKLWDWTIDSEDWRDNKSKEAVLEEIRINLHRPIEVILLHERLRTIEMLPEIVQIVREAGYELETYDEAAHVSINFLHEASL